MVEGGPAVGTKLSTMRFDLIAFTGGSQIGKFIAAEAGKNLVPCVLELGGMNPCVVDTTADVEFAVKKIVLGRFLNGGQICTAPDVVYIPVEMKT
jgi:aldehyde dehydrogenase (NAD+)